MYIMTTMENKDGFKLNESVQQKTSFISNEVDNRAFGETWKEKHKTIIEDVYNRKANYLVLKAHILSYYNHDKITSRIGSTPYLEELVNLYIMEGYEPIGTVFMDGMQYYCQAVYKNTAYPPRY